MAIADRPTPSKDIVINLRAKQSQRELIDQAAAALGKSRSDFMIESSLRAAETVLLERLFFHLDEAAYAQFIAALEGPPQLNERLLTTLSAKAPWE
ncbi:DUF1778 domain-containing protein [Gloeobacter morelensis]|uniref:DUF1778 domain-containing protein n=1 Tax=Gloeobacter morelensis MG652769 TaxID=2781736 RepID=A0ABY3PKW8_9CYAN|nr:DUF1778 domain-containing protein [Gloeobacter morelensis]UFP94268.1 DUF1778 domain-containing protein [Gloeobacter morelensis MG652769]